MVDKTINSGVQAYHCLAAAPSSVGAAVLEELAQSAGESTRYQVTVSAWEETSSGQQCELTMALPEETRRIRLFIGNHTMVGDCLRFTEGWTGKPFLPQSDQVVIDPRCVKSAGRIRDIGRQVLVAAVVHGFGWVDRIGRVVDTPFGYRPKREVQKTFHLVLGPTVSPQELSNIPGLFFAPHVGEWGSGVRVVPAVARLPLVLHEFRANGADHGSQVNTYHGEVISDDIGRWAGVMRFSKRPRAREVRFVSELASSPFSFHVAATKQHFMRATLSATALLAHFGEVRLHAMLTALLEQCPTRFYRLIDALGVSHRQKSADAKSLYFDTRAFPRAEVVENIITTFHELRQLELVPETVLRERERVVLDDSTYIVLTALMMGKNGAAAVLSGSKMVDYLFTGATAHMHRVACEKVFSAIRAVVPEVPQNFTCTIYDSAQLYCEGSQYDPAVRARAMELIEARSLSSVG